MLLPPDADGRVGAGAEHEEERECVGARGAEADERTDVDDREHDRRVEDVPAPVRPRLDVAPPFAPEQEEEERDREEERDPEQPADSGEHGLEREHDDDARDQRDDQEPAQGRVHVGEEALHDPPVMKARTASAAATREVPANQSRRFGPCAGA